MMLGMIRNSNTIPYPDAISTPVPYEMRTVAEMSALPEETKLAMLKDAKSGTWYDGWQPYCMTCPTVMRMDTKEYGFRCSCCGNMIGWDCKRLVESPLNRR